MQPGPGLPLHQQQASSSQLGAPMHPPQLGDCCCCDLPAAVRSMHPWGWEITAASYDQEPHSSEYWILAAPSSCGLQVLAAAGRKRGWQCIVLSCREGGEAVLHSPQLPGAVWSETPLSCRTPSHSRAWCIPVADSGQLMGFPATRADPATCVN